ncbi:MAG: hypothetical protein MRZ79_15325 [Bacteroidia bacterium]|nr:hypothetical protein [Bacteroidia bacterium]
MIKFKSIALILFLFPALVGAQVLKQKNDLSQTLNNPDDYPFSVYLVLGIPGGSISYDLGYQNLYSSMRERDILLPNLSAIANFAVGARYKRLWAEVLIGTNFSFMDLPPFESRRFDIISGQDMTSFSIGYSIFQDRNTSLVLRAGFGQTLTGHSITPRVEDAFIDFDILDPNAGPNSFPVIYHQSEFVDLSMEWRIGREKTRIGLAESIRLGYRYGLEKKPWEVVNATAINTPLDRLSQVFFQVSFNITHNFPRKDKK